MRTYPNDHSNLGVKPLIDCSVGLGFVHAFLEKGYTVIAAIRDVSKMPKLDGVITVKIAADSKTDAKQVSECVLASCSLSAAAPRSHKRVVLKDQW